MAALSYETVPLEPLGPVALTPPRGSVCLLAASAALLVTALVLTLAPQAPVPGWFLLSPPSNVIPQRVRAWPPVPPPRAAPLRTSAFQDPADLFQFGLEAADKLTRGLRPRPLGFPPGPSGDVSLELLQDPLPFLERTEAAYGGSVGMVLAGEYVVLLSDPVLCRQVWLRVWPSGPCREAWLEHCHRGR